MNWPDLVSYASEAGEPDGPLLQSRGSIRRHGVRGCVAVMGGGEDQFLEGSVLGASFWRWWNRAWAGEPAVKNRPAAEEESSDPPATHQQAPVLSQELVYIAAVVPRPRPPRRPAKSKPIDIPTKKAVYVPVFDIAEDKRYWYQ